MLKLNDVPPEEQSEVFRLADEMYRRESEENRERKAATDAAQELGVPPEYLERAAAELHARKLEKIEKNRHRNRLVAVGIVGIVLVGMGAAMFTSSGSSRKSSGPIAGPVSPITLDPKGATVRQSSSDPAAARVSVDGGRVTLDVSRMAPNGRGQVFANAAVPIGRSLAGYRTLLVTYSGEGLPNVRVDLEAGDVRWKSQNLPIGASRTAEIPLDGMRKQARKSGGNGFGGVRWTAPDNAQEIVFKVGETINPTDASGKVTIEKIEFR